MEATTIAPPSIPRLRVLRQSYSANDTSRTSTEAQAGPSRLPMDSENVSNDEEEQKQSTPSQLDLIGTPAARLRAVLGKLHDNSQKDQSTSQPETPSELDSDFDPPAKLTASATSFAQKSLMDVFSYARREPGDTPQKGKSVRRRNSVGESHAFASPRAQRIQQERQENKGNRKSLSDEEVENASLQRSDLSSRSSQAATFDTLRERLTSSYTPLRNQEPPTFLTDSAFKSDGMDSVNPSRSFNSSQATPPAATSTPQQSLHISTNSAYSNLLDQDTEMQQAMKGLDISYDTPVHQTTTSTPRLPSIHDSASASKSRKPYDPHERERKPHHKHHSDTPELKHRHSLSTSLRRQSSTTSLRSVEDEHSSRASSAISHTEYLEHIKELEKERNHEREREWNRTHSPASNLNSVIHTHAPRPEGRTRTHSHPLRPDSALSLRSQSSASSHHSHEEEEELKAEVDHERERNWNAPRPKWQTHHSYSSHSQHRSSSPLLQSPTSSPTSNHRMRTTSLSMGGTSKGQSPAIRSASQVPSQSPLMVNGKGLSPRQKTPLQRPLSYPARPNSPLPQTSRDIATSSVSSLQRTRTHSRQSEQDLPRFTHTRAPSSPSPSPKTPSSSKYSHIPIRSSSKKIHVSQSSISTLEVPAPLSKAGLNTSKRDDELGTEDSAAQDTTPTMKSVKTLSSAERVPLSRSPSPAQRMESNSPIPVTSQPLSPPPSPPSEPSSPTRPLHTKPLFSLPSTPPSRPSFSARVEFPTPSPPKGLPDLPDPPSSEDEESENHHKTPGRHSQDNTTTFKTPKVPGAYFTPAQPPENRLARAHSLPPEEDLSSTDSGLATPAPSMSRTSSLPPQTPILPGGWMNTTLKTVRFDSQPNTPATPSSVTTELSSVSEVATSPQTNGVLNVSASGVQVRPQTPPISPSRNAHKHSSIRVVDEFGRERESVTVDTPRNKSTVRIVDAMGREVDHIEEGAEVQVPRKDALLHIRQGISELGKELEAAAERSNDVSIDSGHIKELDEISKAARKVRAELLSGPIRASMRQTKLFMSASRPNTQHWKRWKFWAAALAQFFFCLLFFSWLSGMRARHLFLTTYYDPFYHDLHLYMIKPSDYRSPSAWSVLEVFRRQGMRAVVMQLFRDASLTLADWRKSAWDLWGDEVQTPPWPPT